ncbi:MAG: alpha/beta fold hydrolase [Pirellulales bacterium]
MLRASNDRPFYSTSSVNTAWEGALRGRQFAAAGWALLLLCLSAGCASNDYLRVRQVPRNPLAESLDLLSWSGPKPTPRTEQLLRRYDLLNERTSNATVALASLEQEIQGQPAPEKIYAFAELAYVDGKRAEDQGRQEQALDDYGASLGHAYRYLFDTHLDWTRNPYDPQFRQACDLYNGALEASLRILRERKQLKPGSTQHIKTEQCDLELVIELHGPWRAEDVERLEFASDFEVAGLTNQYRTYGLGVPLIAVRRPVAQRVGVEAYYPQQLSFPVTAFLRVNRPSDHVRQMSGETPPRRFVLELHNPLVEQQVRVGDRLVPLETDLSTPLAHFLDSMEVKEETLATLGLREPAVAEQLSQIYMLEPYSPHKIPVIMVHGLWSSPMTWMEMFNDLRALPEIRESFQFWFYMYPTGQPFWASAADFRDDLRELQQQLDPQGASAAMQNMVLVGHSMGGLVSRMQTIEPGDRLWKLVSDRPFAELKADEATRRQLSRVVFFEPNPAVKRVITIGTPHHGSKFANDYTRWLGRKLISMPKQLIYSSQKLSRDNPNYFRNIEPLMITTSIDSLAPECPIFGVLNRAPRASWVKYDNIAGLVPKDDLLGRFSPGGDGIVSFKSAHLDEADSELVVPASHTSVHRHPRSILTVGKLLLEHRDEVRQGAPTPPDTTPAMFTTPPPALLPDGESVRR